jgi:hypothetical protein
MSFEPIIKDSVGATALLVKSGKITVDMVHAVNTTGAAAYLQIFDAAAAADVTVGTTLPMIVVKSAASDPAEILLDGCVFQLGVVVASTTTALGNTGATQHVRLGVR